MYMYPMLFYAMLCYPMYMYRMLFYVMLCYPMYMYRMLFYVMLCYPMYMYRMLFYVMLCYPMYMYRMLFLSILFYAVLWCIVAYIQNLSQGHHTNIIIFDHGRGGGWEGAPIYSRRGCSSKFSKETPKSYHIGCWSSQFYSL